MRDYRKVRASTTRSSRSRCSRPSAPSSSRNSSCAATARSFPAARSASQSICFPDVAYEPQRRVGQLDSTVHLPRRSVAVHRRDRTVTARNAAVDHRNPGHQGRLRAHARDLARILMAHLPRWRHGLRRPLRSNVGVLPIAVRGGLATGLVQDQQIVAREGSRSTALTDFVGGPFG